MQSALTSPLKPATRQPQRLKNNRALSNEEEARQNTATDAEMFDYISELAIEAQQWQFDNSFKKSLTRGKEKGFSSMQDYKTRSKEYRLRLQSKRKQQTAVAERGNKALAAKTAFTRLRPALTSLGFIGLLAYLLLSKNLFLGFTDDSQNIFAAATKTTLPEQTVTLLQRNKEIVPTEAITVHDPRVSRKKQDMPTAAPTIAPITQTQTQNDTLLPQTKRTPKGTPPDYKSFLSTVFFGLGGIALFFAVISKIRKGKKKPVEEITDDDTESADPD